MFTVYMVFLAIKELFIVKVKIYDEYSRFELINILSSTMRLLNSTE